MRKILLSALLAALTLVPTRAFATAISYDYTAHVTLTNLPGISFGDLITGTLVYDTSVTDGSALSSVGAYSGAVDSLTIDVGPYSVALTNGDLTVLNDFPIFFVLPTDLFFADFSSGSGPSGSLALANVGFPPVAPLTSDAIPTDLTLAPWLLANVEGESHGEFVKGELATLNRTELPEPATLWLVGVGLAAAGRKRFR